MLANLRRCGDQSRCPPPVPCRPKHQIEVAWTQSKKRWKHRAVQPQGDQTHHDRHDLPIVVAQFTQVKKKIRVPERHILPRNVTKCDKM